MKKYIVLVLTLICVLSIAGCKRENDENSTNASGFLPDIQTLQVTFYSGQDVHKWELTQNEIDEWIVWLNSLFLEQIKFDVGDTPNDNIEGGSKYVFEANSDKKQIEYIDYGSYGVYLLVDSEWYQVSNPTEPFNKY